MLKVLRRGSTRYLALSAVLLTVLLCLYYANYNGTATDNSAVVTSSVSVSLTSGVVAEPRREEDAAAPANQDRAPEPDLLEPEPDAVITPDTCPVVPAAKTDVDTVEQFKTFEFQVRALPFVVGVSSHGRTRVVPSVPRQEWAIFPMATDIVVSRDIRSDSNVQGIKCQNEEMINTFNLLR
jgi:hypothetical protein